jgi:uncharacterized membrane protein
MGIAQRVGQVLLGLALAYAGFTHLTSSRLEFQAQVPTVFKDYADFVVLASGVVEIVLGLSLIGLWRFRVQVGLIVAAFFVAVFPGNISQYATIREAESLIVDLKNVNKPSALAKKISESRELLTLASVAVVGLGVGVFALVAWAVIG